MNSDASYDKIKHLVEVEDDIACLELKYSILKYNIESFQKIKNNLIYSQK